MGNWYSDDIGDGIRIGNRTYSSDSHALRSELARIGAELDNLRRGQLAITEMLEAALGMGDDPRQDTLPRSGAG